jgi:carbon monoxide dehydrogenase subunit G
MKLSGTAELHAPVERVYAALADPGVLVRTIPGCEQLETVGDDTYKMTITAGVASIKGTYLGSVQIVDQDPPHGYTLKASGQSAAGSIDASAKIKLSGNGAGTTLLGYDADAVVAGAIGGVGQRMLTGVAKKLAAEFFTAVDRDLEYGPAGAAPPAAAAAAAGSAALPAAGPAIGAAPAAGAVYRRPEQPRPPGVPTGPLLLFAAAAVGAAVALAGVALGGRLARGAKKP